MICKYCEIGSYFGTCLCTKENTVCPFMRRCSMEHKWLPLHGMDDCLVRKEGVKVGNLSKNEYIVSFVRNGKIYVDINGIMYKFSNPYDYEPKTIKLIKIDDVYYIEGFEPKKEKIKNKKDKHKNEG